MEYKELIHRYFNGELSTAEEQILRDRLITSADEELTPEEIAAKALLRYASLKSDASVSIKLHDGAEKQHSRFGDAIIALCSLHYARIAMSAALGICAIAFAIYYTRPTIYGYHNGEPITSYAEAQILAQNIFDNLANVGLAKEYDLQELFTID